MPGGAPSKLDQVVGYRDADGDRVPVTAFDRIVAGQRTGNYIEVSAASAGVGRSTVFGWLKIGAQVYARAALRGLEVDDPALDLTPHEQRCREFSDAVAEANASYEIGEQANLNRLARGGLTTVRTTVKTQRQPVPGKDNEYAMVEVERTVVTETLAPNAQVIEWRLTRKFPDRYALRSDLDDPLGGIDETAESLAGEVRTYLQGVDDGAAAKPTRKRKAKA